MSRTHESYAVATLHRSSHSGTPRLFRSTAHRGETITVEIKRAKVDDPELGHEFVYAEEELIEIEFSPLQWAEFLSSMNEGSGTPTTLRYFNGAEMERPPEREKGEARIAAEELADTFGDLGGFAQEAQALVADLEAKGSKMNKADREKLLDVVRRLAQGVDSSLPFYVQETQKGLGRMEAEVKASLTAFATMKGLTPGSADGPPLLEGGVEIDTPAGPVTMTSLPAPEDPNRSAMVVKTDLPALPSRDLWTKPVVDCTPRELAIRIDRIVKLIERKQRADNAKAGPQAAREDLDCWYGANAQDRPGGKDGTKIYVNYRAIGMGSGTPMTIDEARVYLAYLLDGGEERHHEHLRSLKR